MSRGVSQQYSMENSNNKMRHLVSSRLEDIRDGFEEELEESKPKKRPHENSEKLTDSEDEDDVFDEIPPKMPRTDNESKGAALMAKMGYGGGGLGKTGQGRTEPIPLSTQRGREGLGHRAVQKVIRDWNAVWDSSKEVKTVEESVRWLSASDEIREKFLQELCDDWIAIGDRKETLDDEDKYCDGELVKQMLEAKSVFDQLDSRDLRDARTRANPYETIGCAFFQNRAAMKMANLDRIYDWLLTNEKWDSVEVKNPITVEVKNGKCGENTDRSLPLFYFADVCAGPGGFTEYVLWRKGYYNAKGFGMTLKGKDDFKLKRFTAASPAYFEPYYGKHDDGDVTKPENITSFEEFVKRGTNNAGVNLMMADGGFCVDSQENIQEILSKRLYLCQFLIGLSILRTAQRGAGDGGRFVCKLFDILTPFSVGLIYLMYIVFERISIHKPNTSRPANSERYIVCDSPLKCCISEIKKYMTKINNELDRLSVDKTHDVREVVPEDVIQLDKVFMDYIVEHNERTIKRQTNYLNKYKIFAQNVSQLDRDQEKLRNECLQYWKIPDITKKRPNELHESIDRAVSRLVKSIDFEELKRRPPPLTKSVLSGGTNRIRYAELLMCALTEKDPPVLLFSIQMGIYFYSPQSSQGFERIPFDANIPKDTVLLAQITKAYRGLDDKGRLEGECATIRILDAAMLGGDNVSELPFDERIAAAEKMCKAVKIVHSTSDKKIAPICAAKIFKLNELRFEMKRFHVIHAKGEEVAVIEEGDELSRSFFYCRGMRVISILVDPWIMCWSRRQEQPYAFNTAQGKSVYSKEFEKARCCLNFWKALIIKKPSHDGDSSKYNCYQWLWDWTQNFVDGEDYGPRPILEAEEHPGGLTWRSVYNIAQQQKDSVCRKPA